MKMKKTARPFVTLTVVEIAVAAVAPVPITDGAVFVRELRNWRSI